MIKKVIAYDDDPDFRGRLSAVFNGLKKEYDLLALYPQANEVLDHIKKYQPDVILMDIEMHEHDEDGLLALYTIKKAHPHQKVLMLTTFDNDDKIFNAICLRADGYMLKTDFAEYLPHVILRQSLNIIFNDGAYLTPAVAKKILYLFQDIGIGDKIQQVVTRFTHVLMQYKNPKGKNASYKLTPAQLIILQRIADGKTAGQIAKEQGVTENTINTHIKAIYRELEVHTRGEAVRKGYEEKLIKLKK
jgi:DNA-binding NarL/FixJ family response regulator